ncbi:MAG: DUF4339 domain-containing protein, partial [Lentisphaerae bacterium]|nr:DUF4339 domain-containing protein [Lentisphaerota bacterium]
MAGKWFYSRSGKFREHGLVTEEELYEMAREGRLTANDLLWDPSSDAGWVRASSIESLSDKLLLEPQVTTSNNTDFRAMPEHDTVYLHSHGRLAKTIVVVVVFICVASLVWFLRSDNDEQVISDNVIRPDLVPDALPGKPEPTVTNGEFSVEQDNWRETASRISASIDNGDVVRSEKLLTKMIAATGTNNVSEELGQRLADLKV